MSIFKPKTNGITSPKIHGIVGLIQGAIEFILALILISYMIFSFFESTSLIEKFNTILLILFGGFILIDGIKTLLLASMFIKVDKQNE